MLTTMSKGTESVGLVVINEEIENALELYPDESYKKVFANPELREKLVNYVMSGIQSIHPVHTKRPISPVKTKFPYHSLELRLHIESYVHWGIEYLLGVNADWMSPLTTQDAQPSYSPFHNLN